jgi:transglycosylase-like protein with SLT domain
MLAASLAPKRADESHATNPMPGRIIFLLFCGAAIAGQQTRSPSDLDRVTYAVDGAESSHGNNPAMWRADPSGPQGPMQVSEKAASDAGGGNRFDMDQNRRLGRAYLGLLQRRYGNWGYAISAYNWGWVELTLGLNRATGAKSWHPVLQPMSSGFCETAAYPAQVPVPSATSGTMTSFSCPGFNRADYRCRGWQAVAPRCRG